MNLTILTEGGVSPPRSYLASTLSFHDVSQHAATSLKGDAFPVCGLALAVLLVFLVVVPAVWSRQAERREAAFRVLDRILRFPPLAMTPQLPAAGLQHGRPPEANTASVSIEASKGVRTAVATSEVSGTARSSAA